MVTKEEISQWTDKQIDDEVKRIFIKRSEEGKESITLTEELTFSLARAEYWKRENAGLHVIPCMICTDSNVSYYDIMKQFCSNIHKVRENICDKHISFFEMKKEEFYGYVQDADKPEENGHGE